VLKYDCSNFYRVSKLLSSLGFLGITQLKNNGTGITAIRNSLSVQVERGVSHTCVNINIGQLSGFFERIYREKHGKTNYKTVEKIPLCAVFCLERFVQKALP